MEGEREGGKEGGKEGERGEGQMGGRDGEREREREGGTDGREAWRGVMEGCREGGGARAKSHNQPVLFNSIVLIRLVHI